MHASFHPLLHDVSQCFQFLRSAYGETNSAQWEGHTTNWLSSGSTITNMSGDVIIWSDEEAAADNSVELMEVFD